MAETQTLSVESSFAEKAAQIFPPPTRVRIPEVQEYVKGHFAEVPGVESWTPAECHIIYAVARQRDYVNRVDALSDILPEQQNALKAASLNALRGMISIRMWIGELPEVAQRGVQLMTGIKPIRPEVVGRVSKVITGTEEGLAASTLGIGEVPQSFITLDQLQAVAVWLGSEFSGELELINQMSMSDKTMPEREALLEQMQLRAAVVDRDALKQQRIKANLVVPILKGAIAVTDLYGAGGPQVDIYIEKVWQILAVHHHLIVTSAVPSVVFPGEDQGALRSDFRVVSFTKVGMTYFALNQRGDVPAIIQENVDAVTALATSA